MTNDSARRAALALGACFALAASAQAGAGEVGINLYGLSYHFDDDRARQLDIDNTVNPGLGVRYRFADWERWTFFVDAGVYYDSGKNSALITGVGALWKVAGGLQIGGAAAVFSSDTYNDGRTFVAPLPLVAYDFGPVMLNLTYFPKIERYNDVATLGLWLTLWPERW